MITHLELTGKCNLRCDHCYNNSFVSKSTRADELTHEEWLQVIKEANELGCTRFTFSGGEPLEYADRDRDKFLELVNACEAPLILLTNGHYLDEELLSELVKTEKLKAIRLSLDGLASHNKFRSGGDYELVINKVRMINEMCDIPVAVVTMLHSGNLPEIMQMYDVLKTTNIARWGIDMPFSSSHYSRAGARFTTPDYTDIVATMKELLIRYLADGKPFQLGAVNIYKSEIASLPKFEFDVDVHPCCYKNILSIKPTGEVHVCAAYNHKVASVRGASSLKETREVARSHPFYEMRVSDIKECTTCRYLALCGGGCRADANFLTGSDKNPDPRNCELLPLVEKEIFPILPEEERLVLESLCNPEGIMPPGFS